MIILARLKSAGAIEPVRARYLAYIGGDSRTIPYRRWRGGAGTLPLSVHSQWQKWPLASFRPSTFHFIPHLQKNHTRAEGWGPALTLQARIACEALDVPFPCSAGEGRRDGGQ